MQRMLRTTTHAVVRQAQRNLSAQDIEFVIANGQCVYSGGALHIFLRNRDIPVEVCSASFFDPEGSRLRV